MSADHAQMAPGRRAGTEFAFTLEPDAHAPSEARRELAERLPGRLPPDLVDDVLLLTTELVTNGVRHSPAQQRIGTVDVSVRLGADRVRVEVSDPGSGFDHVPHVPGTLSEGGRGLFLVEALADRWGIADGRRTTVWYELGVEGGEPAREPRSEDAELAAGVDELAAELRALGAATDSLDRKSRAIEADLDRVAGSLKAGADALRAREKLAHPDPDDA